MWNDDLESHRNGRFFLTANLEADMNRKPRYRPGSILLRAAGLIGFLTVVAAGVLAAIVGGI